MKKICPKCKNEIKDGELTCQNCGLDYDAYMDEYKAKMSIIGAIIFPIVGLILGIPGMIKSKNPKTRIKYIIALIISVVWIAAAVVINIMMNM